MGGTWSFAEGETLEYMIKEKAEGLTRFNHAYFNGMPCLSTALEEAFHVRQFMEGRPEHNGLEAKLAGYLKEVEAQEYLLTQTKIYGINDDEVEATQKALRYYQEMAERRREWLRHS